jgi:hypothetical protein
MDNSTPIDITCDFRSDTPPGKDPDSRSPTLRRYHKLLWSKPLPSGVVFELVDTAPGIYLRHRSKLGEFRLTSDGVIATLRKEARISHILEQIPGELATFRQIGATIGGRIVFPGIKVDGQMTINGARGCNHYIKDRFDLTLECIRRHYRGEASPLSGVLARYANFFQLFGDFRGYVEFFLLQDLVNEDCVAVQFFAPFEDFGPWPVPDSLAAYLDYRALAIGFIEARNRRISKWWESHRGG